MGAKALGERVLNYKVPVFVSPLIFAAFDLNFEFRNLLPSVIDCLFLPLRILLKGRGYDLTAVIEPSQLLIFPKASSLIFIKFYEFYDGLSDSTHAFVLLAALLLTLPSLI